MRETTKQELSNLIGDHQHAKLLGTCEDCGQDITILVERIGPRDIKIDGGVLALRWKCGQSKFLFKHFDCFKDNPNWGPKVDIYSRVVGFLRPVKDWNAGKHEEYKQRQVFATDEGWVTAKESKYVKAELY